MERCDGKRGCWEAGNEGLWWWGAMGEDISDGKIGGELDEGMRMKRKRVLAICPVVRAPSGRGEKVDPLLTKHTTSRLQFPPQNSAITIGTLSKFKWSTIVRHCKQMVTILMSKNYMNVICNCCIRLYMRANTGNVQLKHLPWISNCALNTCIGWVYLRIQITDIFCGIKTHIQYA